MSAEDLLLTLKTSRDTLMMLAAKIQALHEQLEKEIESQNMLNKYHIMIQGSY